MRFFVLLLAAIFAASALRAQSDSIKATSTNSDTLSKRPVAKKPWAYTSYQEFLDNKPTILSGFTITPFTDKEGTMIVAAKITFDDSIKHKPEIWGFCDGNMVFISPPKGLFSKKMFVPLEYIGKNSFYTIGKKDVYAIGPMGINVLSAAISSATSKTYYYVMVINDKGKSVEAEPGVIMKLFQSRPDILKDYEAEPIQLKYSKMKEYLVRFNRSFE